ncbi:MAG: hypothetical protein ACU83O_02175, partial [Gammaproteobacteria bacterium]
KVAIHGMDGRFSQSLMLFLQGPCRGSAIIVNDEDADADIFDADVTESKNLLEKHLQGNVIKPLIVLSLKDFTCEDVFHIKKPVKTENMLWVLDKVKNFLIELDKAKKILSEFSKRHAAETVSLLNESSLEAGESDKQDIKAYLIDQDESKKTAKHRTAMRLYEKNFLSYIGEIPNLDGNDSKPFMKAYYNPKDYLQGYLDSALRACRLKNQISQMQFGWKQVTLFPHSQEIWHQTDDLQLKSFAGIKMGNFFETTSLVPVNPKTIQLGDALDKVQSTDAFLWKIACWTSKGRYPVTIDLNQPVYLKNWPNFTRLLITPHALRIAALLMQGPRTMTNAAHVLKIEPRYVFIFISAAYALGMAGQARRDVDRLIQAGGIKASKNRRMLEGIVSQLRNHDA